MSVQPDVVVSNGAAVAVPFFLEARTEEDPNGLRRGVRPGRFAHVDRPAGAPDRNLLPRAVARAAGVVSGQHPDRNDLLRPPARPRVVYRSEPTNTHSTDSFGGWIVSPSSHPEVDVFMQFGTAEPPSSGAGAPLVSHAELLDMIVDRDVVVTHGGPSTVMDVRSSGRVPIVVARDPAFGEHVDHHQQRFAAHLAERGLARLASTEESLLELILAGLADPAGSTARSRRRHRRTGSSGVRRSHGSAARYRDALMTATDSGHTEIAPGVVGRRAHPPSPRTSPPNRRFDPRSGLLRTDSDHRRVRCLRTRPFAGSGESPAQRSGDEERPHPRTRRRPQQWHRSRRPSVGRLLRR